MKVEEVSVLLPCHSLEDFPTYYEGDDAEGLLSAWVAMWHPALLAATRKLPDWHRADNPPDPAAGCLYVIPPTSEQLLDAGWFEQAVDAGARVVRQLISREEIIAALLAALDSPPAPIDEELTADFLALGYGYLSVELLTRQMRYMSNIDEVRLEKETAAAATACTAGGTPAQVREQLRNCFEILTEARERFYPVDAYMIDLTLVAPTAAGEALRHQLAGDVPQNVLLTGASLAHFATAEPDTILALRAALDRSSLSLVGGERGETALPLLPIEGVLREFQAGKQLFEQHVGQAPRVYGRRRNGLTPILPQILARFDYVGALHATLDDGRFPTSSQSKVSWVGIDDSPIDALARVPLDATRAETFLALPRTLGESMDRDHVATVVLAHWPAPVHPCYHDLRRMAAYSPVMARFVTLDDYFAETTSPSESARFRPDRYHYPYLRQAVAAHLPRPISDIVAEHEHESQHFAAETTEALADFLGAAPDARRQTGDPTATPSLAELQERESAAAARLVSAVSDPQGAPGLMIVNPQSFPRRVAIDVTGLPSLPSIEAPVVAVQESVGVRTAVVDLPGAGVCWVGPATGAPEPPAKKKTKPPASIAAGSTLSNEFVRIEINPQTGAVHAVYDVARRGKVLSSQLALRTPPPAPRPGERWRDPEHHAVYSSMVADAIEIGRNGPALGELICRGRLLDDSQTVLARFEQRYALTAGARVVSVETELSIDQLPTGNPWHSYYATRFAWSDEAADLHRDVGLARQPTEARHLEAPNFIEIDDARSRVAILCSGLPYHRRSGPRMLDTLLVVAGETARRFRYGIGVGLAHPAQQSLDFLQPPTVVPAARRPAGPHPAPWLLYVDAENVVLTHLAAVREEGRVVGVRARLIETSGRAGRVRLRGLHDFAEAERVDFRSDPLGTLPVDGDCVTIDVAGFEWVEVVARLRQ